MLAYGTSLAAAARRMAGMVDRILKGTRPGDLPVECVARPELVVNLKVAREIAVTVPPEVLARRPGDRVGPIGHGFLRSRQPTRKVVLRQRLPRR